MGNGIGRLNLCFAGDAGEISRRRHDIALYLSDPLDEGLGHSFCYIKPDPSRLSSDDSTTLFHTISGASISANTSTPLSTSLIDPFLFTKIDKASSFESSDSFSSIPLQPIPRNSIPSVRSGPISQSSGMVFGSGPIERGFLSGPIERSFISGPFESQFDQVEMFKPKSKKWDLIKFLKRAMAKSKFLGVQGAKESNWVNGSGQNNDNGTEKSGSNNLSSELSLREEEVESFVGPNVEWAQGKAGEDRVHVVISEENGWVFVGIYDGFNGPDATDYLLNNLYSNVYKELKGLLWYEKSELTPNFMPNDSNSSTNLNLENEISLQNGEFDQSSGNEGSKLDILSKKTKTGEETGEESQRRWNCQLDKGREELEKSVDHSDVLKAISEALRKTEEEYLDIADMMVLENPELALMGSCVLAMLMKGDDVYLMNVGDSRAVLARKVEPESRIWKMREETLNDLEGFNGDEFEISPSLGSCQLTIDHSTSVEGEIRRIKKEHPDDASAVMNNRVKGSLKVTRAFGAGFLKQPKWNNALLEVFQIDYVGTSPYISCSPSLHHHRLGPRDRFLILSSDGLYQYFTNEDAVSEVEMFIATSPEGDPAQHLVEEVLFRAAKKAGMDFHDLLDIPQGDRRRYHDDVSIIIVSFEGRLWRSSA